MPRSSPPKSISPSGSSRLLKNIVQFGADKDGILAHATLLKWTNLMSGFQPRYFELRVDDGGAKLAYALSAPAPGEKMDARGILSMANATVAVQQGSSRNLTVTIASTGKPFARIRCASEMERQEWITTLELAQRTAGGALRAEELRMEAESTASSADHNSDSPTSEGDARTPSRGSYSDPSPQGHPSVSSPSAMDTTTTEGESDDTEDELDGEGSANVRQVLMYHALLRKQCEALSAKLVTVADGGDAAALPFDAADFERVYCNLLGLGSDVVNKGISWKHRWNQRLLKSAMACEELERQVRAIREDIDKMRVAEAIASRD
eukprot:m.201211 g.201211  ORF g.201211 m.201211 type:complete len:322 (-) comp21350_c0_seq1:9-974(-)